MIMLMYSALVTGTFLLFGIVVVLLFGWVISFAMLLGRLQKHHPIYYKTIHRPYSWFTSTDILLKYGGFNGKRRRAWWRYLREVYKVMPPLVLRDHVCHRLARFYRRAMQLFLVVSSAFVLFVLPLDVFALATSNQPSVTPQQTPPIAQPTNTTSPSVDGGSDANTPSSQTTTPTTQNTATTETTTTTTVVKGTTEGTVSGAVTVGALPTVAVPLLQPGHVSRADLTVAFQSIAPAGQQKARKRDVCSQLITQSVPNSDLAPAGDDICTDSNLATYSAY